MQTGRVITETIEWSARGDLGCDVNLSLRRRVLESHEERIKLLVKLSNAMDIMERKGAARRVRNAHKSV